MKSMRYILATAIVISLLPVGLIHAQNVQWQLLHDESAWESAADIAETPDGGYITAGVRIHYPGSEAGPADTIDAFIVKMSNEGVVRWSRRLGEIGYPRGVVPWKDGTALVMVQSTSWVLLTIDSSGSVVRRDTTVSANGELYSKAIRTRDGGFVMVGFLRLRHEMLGTFIHKFDSNGVHQWSRKRTGSDGHGVAQLSDGSFVVAASILDSIGAIHDPILFRFSEQGDSLWTRRYWSSGSDGAYAVIEASDGGLVIGCAHGTASLRLIKTDSNGDIIWDMMHTDSTLGPAYGGVAACLVARRNGGYTFVTNQQTSLFNFDGAGRWEGKVSYEHADTVHGPVISAIRSTSDDGFIVAGWGYASVLNHQDLLALKLKSSLLSAPQTSSPAMRLRLW